MQRNSYSFSKNLLATISLILLTLIFFYKILLTNLILVGVDIFLYFYPYKAYMSEALQQGRLPLWNPHLFMGVPFLANSQVGLFYPLNWLFIFIGLGVPKQVAWSMGLHIALAGILMFHFARSSLKLEWEAAFGSALLFAFGGYLGAQVEHINQLNAAIWLPLLFHLYEKSLQKRYYLLWLTLVIALTLFAGHTQTVFISLFGLGLYALWRAGETILSQQSFTTLLSLSPTRWGGTIGPIFQHLWPVALASGLAAAVAAIQLLPTAELSSLSIRSEGLTFREVVSFSLSPTQFHYALLPPHFLDLTQVLGEAFGEWTAYLGISGLILAIAGGFLSLWHPQPRRFLFIALSGLILSLGIYNGPLYYALYHLVPGFDLFRVPARWLLLYSFGMSLLAGFALQSIKELSAHLHQVWTHPRYRPLFLGIALLLILAMLALIGWHRPPLLTMSGWLLFALITIGILYKSKSIPRSSLILLLGLELFLASQTLNYNHPTAPQAYHSMRNAVAFLLSTESTSPPDRFLSLSGITYDPGDLHDLRLIYGDHLSEKALYRLIVATKQKEVLFFNLPMIYGLHSVDGYDGGILPLLRFITLQHLFLPPDNLSLDGRLREKLQFVPENRLLSMLNTRWIITDKMFDVWIDGIFYDLQFPISLSSEESITVTEVSSFPATAVGLVSYLEGATTLSANSPVAEIRFTFADGTTDTFILKAGTETAEGHYTPEVAHPQATIGVPWPYGADGVGYITRHTWPQSRQIIKISIQATLSEGQFVLQGLSLIHEPTTTSKSVLVSKSYRQVHSGDVKIYENLSVLPRAFIVHQAEQIADPEQALALMQQPDFNPAEKLVRLSSDEQSLHRGHPSPDDRVTILSYEPERIEMNVTLSSPGWLILTDSYYPGWQATIDSQSAEIFPANIMFRGLSLPAGDHTIIFEFKPDSVWWGAWISGLTLLILGAALLLS